ncbi:MAG: hypothetical protein ACRECQ_00595 [Burkholderiaceae bacterium]
MIRVGDKRYVGSTIKTMPQRMAGHRADTTNAPERRLYDAIADAGGWSAATIEILEVYPCSSEVRGERHWFDEHILRPAITEDELRRLHREGTAVRRAANPGQHADEERRRVQAQAPDKKAARLAKAKEYRDAHITERKEYEKANRERINAQARARYAAKKAAAATAN